MGARRAAITLAALALAGAGACVLDPFGLGATCSTGGCNDGNPCTEDVCDLETTTCSFVPLAAGAACSDGDACSGEELCDAAGRCQLGEPVEVDDQDPCTEDVCDPESGEVSHTPIAACGSIEWQPLSPDGAPSPRTLHSAVWTGSTMIVWGGMVEGSPNVTDSGAIYDPARNTWSPTSTRDAPSPRHSHSAVWTGREMVVWGGFGAAAYEIDGARYDPGSDSWTPMTTTAAPGGRALHGTVWSGSEMIVWGGLRDVTPLADGGRYDPGSNTWAAVSPAGAPAARFSHAMVWADDQVIVWGGSNTFDWLASGGYYDARTNTWTGVTGVSPLAFRESTSHVWTGSALLVWGGWDGGNYLDDGALLTPGGPAGGTWTSMTNDDAPAGRARHLSLWTGDALFVWGGCAGQICDELFADGGLFTPDATGGQWVPIDEDRDLVARSEHRGVWTGSEVIMFGGRAGGELLGDGARVELP
jgi:hypothetical protein